MLNKIKGAFFGLAVGDALGVPAEFTHRDTLEKNPVTTMIGYGTHKQPAGTWSDDSSLTFCLAESLIKGYDLQDIAQQIVKWQSEAYWTPHGRVFDIGFTTYEAIQRLKKGEDPRLAGEFYEESNGNGSLMRILPLAFYLLDKPVEERFRLAKEVSSITHAHVRSVIACFVYIEFAINLLQGYGKALAYQMAQQTCMAFLDASQITGSETSRFYRLLVGNIYQCYPAEIKSSGYVLHTLEASIWCLLHNTNYHDTVLQAVNLGGDTDTTGAVAGGLAGILYGYDAIPSEWINQLARKEDIMDLVERFANSPALKPVFRS